MQINLKSPLCMHHHRLFFSFCSSKVFYIAALRYYVEAEKLTKVLLSGVYHYTFIITDDLI